MNLPTLEAQAQLSRSLYDAVGTIQKISDLEISLRIEFRMLLNAVEHARIALGKLNAALEAPPAKIRG